MFVFRDHFQRIDAPTVLAIGNFDGLHRGHKALLSKVCEVAKARQLQTAVLTFEPHPSIVLKRAVPRFLMSVTEKIYGFRDAKIDVVAMLRFDTRIASLAPAAFIREFLVDMLQVKHVIVGDGFHFGTKRSGSLETLQSAGRELGFSAEALPEVLFSGERVSSSKIRAALLAGNIAHANNLLGFAYRISGNVVEGDKRGRTIGFPTANIRLKDRFPPLDGVFLVRVYLDQQPYFGVANLGFRKGEFHLNDLPLLETYLFDFAGDLYGKRLRVEFLHKIRSEQTFANLSALKTQIAEDIKEAQKHIRLIAALA